jgi:hypothetical protein
VHRRARNLKDEDIRSIVEIIDDYGENLTWDALIAEIRLRLHSTYTRQALHKHVRIREAFALRKQALQVAPEPTRKRGSIELQKAVERIARLEAENRRLEFENNNLLGQFARWAYNAATRGLDAEFLGRSLPPVDRDRSATV